MIHLTQEEKDLRQAINDKIAEAKKVATEEADLEKAQALVDEINAMKQELSDLQTKQEQLDAIADLEPLEDEETVEEENTTEEPVEPVTEDENKEKRDAEAEVSVEDSETEAPSDTEPTELEKEKRGLDHQEGKDSDMKQIDNLGTSTEVQAFEKFLRSQGAELESRSLTTVEGTVLVPEDIRTTPIREVVDVVDMRNVVNRISVSNGYGKIPVFLGATAVMNTVAELAENPELANPVFNSVTYDIDTYRGYIPVSKELVEDSNYNVLGEVDRYLTEVAVNTANKAICGEMKKFEAKTADTVDALKALVLSFKTGYNVSVVVSKSMFIKLDAEKATDGRPLLQPDYTKASDYSIFGRSLVIVPDEYFGLAGEAHAFVGDVKRAITFFDRKQEGIEWENVKNYGYMMIAVARFDAVVSDEGAGYFVSATAGGAGA